jgi:8-oxo-dGTP pyrophosphatase MutT (NUDIX family)
VKNRLERLRRPLEPAIRRVLHLYWRFARGLTLGVRAVVIDAEGRVFLVRHSYVSGWHLPGGGVEPGETLLAAMARELAEEGQIVVTGEVALHGLFWNARISRRDHVAVYVVRGFRLDPALRRDREIVECGFFHLDALPEETTRGTRARLAEVVGGRLIAEHW